jgi:hypothetical protein
MAMCQAAKEVIWLTGLLQDFGHRLTVTDDRFQRQSGSSRSCTKSGFPSQIKIYHDTIDEGSVEVGVSRSESVMSDMLGF